MLTDAVPEWSTADPFPVSVSWPLTPPARAEGKTYPFSAAEWREWNRNARDETPIFHALVDKAIDRSDKFRPELVRNTDPSRDFDGERAVK